jgi:hypothetical protein
MGRIATNILLVTVLICASMYVLVRSTGLPGALPEGAAASGAESTVRAYYLGVQIYLDSGDMATIRDVVDSGLLEPADAATDTAELGLYLRGLRGTYPEATISIEEITGGGETVVARIAIDHGNGARLPVSPRNSLPPWQQIDTFRVEHGSIVDWQSTGRSSGLFASSPGDAQSLTILERSTMTVSRISFDREDSGFVAISAPALLVSERGGGHFRGNGLAVVASLEHPVGAVSEPGRDINLHPGDSVLLSQGSIVLGAISDRPASLLAILFVPEDQAISDRETHAEFPAPERLLSYASSGQIGRGISIEVLDRAPDAVRGPVQIVAGIAYLAPGNAMAVDRSLLSVVIGSRTGNVERSGGAIAGSLLLECDSQESASVWIAALRPDVDPR